VVVFSEMLEQNLSPSRGMTKQLVRLACEWGLPRLALQVIEEAESLPNAGRTESSAWVQVLQVSADESFLEGVEKAWARTVASRHFTPDEGLLIKILAVAGRWGRTGLATQALAVLPKIGVRAQEHHMAPLIEAFCREGRVPDALKAVGQIRASGITPTMATVSQIVAVLNTPELLDQAFYTLEDMHKAGDAVDVVAFNAVIAAADKLRDLQRARATQLAAADLGVTPNIDTFNYVLRACRSGRHRQLGDDVLAEMTAAGVHPDAESYEHMIHLCLTQTSYEDAFWYLEKMKAEGFRPRQQLYTAIGKRLARNDDSRHKLVAEEMGTLGYAVPDFPALVERENTRRERKGGSNEEGQPPRTDNRSRQSGQRRPRRDNQNRSE
jgi:pentatricopeptide repeat protein